MKLYVLCSYGDGLNDPDVSTDYQELYEKMEKSYRMTLDHVSQTEEEQENTYLSEYSHLPEYLPVSGTLHLPRTQHNGLGNTDRNNRY